MKYIRFKRIQQREDIGNHLAILPNVHSPYYVRCDKMGNILKRNNYTPTIHNYNDMIEYLSNYDIIIVFDFDYTFKIKKT